MVFLRALYYQDRFAPDEGKAEIIHQFTGAPLDGDAVRTPPEFFGEWLYGFTYGGGENQIGIVYRLNRDGSSYEVIRHFERDNKLIGLAAGDGGVWGHRRQQVRRNNRDVNVPVIERFDRDGMEPRVLTTGGGGVAGNTWMGELNGDPVLFGVIRDELFAINLDSVAVPEMETENVPAKPLETAESVEISLGDYGT